MNEIELVVNKDSEPLLDISGSDTQAETPLNRFANALSSPKAILAISGVYLTGYMIFIGKEGGFSSQFLHFGPGTDSTNTTTFIGIVLDSWEKVLLMYAVSFLSAVMNTYYLYAMTNNLHSYIWNRAVPKVPFSRRWTYIVVLAEPFIMQVLSITQFFTNLTMQLQFIIPQFIGSTLIEIPFTIQRLREKEYETD
jgi:hypothetical protein